MAVLPRSVLLFLIWRVAYKNWKIAFSVRNCQIRLIFSNENSLSMAMDGMAGSRDHVHNCVALPMSEVDQNSAETAGGGSICSVCHHHAAGGSGFLLTQRGSLTLHINANAQDWEAENLLLQHKSELSSGDAIWN